jgi:hypothetical protein
MVRLYPRSIPLFLRIPLAALIVMACAATSFKIAYGFFPTGRIGMASAVGVVIGLYAVTASRAEFLRWTERQGVWAALMITYFVRLLLAAASLMAWGSNVQWPLRLDSFIGGWSCKLAGFVLPQTAARSQNMVTFVITIIDAVLQHAPLAILFGMTLAIVKPYCAPSPIERRGFDVLKPGQV